MTNRSLILGKLLVTTAMQAGGTPFVDKCRSEATDGRVFWGVPILLSPWRRNRYGDSLPQRGLVLG